MGYEVKVYVGKVAHRVDDDHGRWFQMWAMFELCKPGYDSEISKLCGDPNVGYEPVFFYCTDGNTAITVDCYGKRLKAIPIDDALKALETDQGNDGYRRFKIAVDLLKSIKEHAGEQLSVILYGH
jgi:hypothetical protein